MESRRLVTRKSALRIIALTTAALLIGGCAKTEIDGTAPDERRTRGEGEGQGGDGGSGD